MLVTSDTMEVVRRSSKDLRLYSESHGEPLKVSTQGGEVVRLLQEAA